MKIAKHSFSIVLFLIALSALIYFKYFDREGQLANHLLQSMDNTDTGVVEVDKQGIIIGVNANMAKLVGYEMAELRGRSLVEIMVPQARSKHPTDFAKVNNITTVVRCKLLRKDGQQEPVLIVARIGAGRSIATVTKEDTVVDHFSKP